MGVTAPDVESLKLSLLQGFLMDVVRWRLVAALPVSSCVARLRVRSLLQGALTGPARWRLVAMRYCTTALLVPLLYWYYRATVPQKVVLAPAYGYRVTDITW